MLAMHCTIQVISHCLLMSQQDSVCTVNIWVFTKMILIDTIMSQECEFSETCTVDCWWICDLWQTQWLQTCTWLHELTVSIVIPPNIFINDHDQWLKNTHNYHYPVTWDTVVRVLGGSVGSHWIMYQDHLQTQLIFMIM